MAINLDLDLACIVCWGRSGSLLMGALLDNHPQTLVVHHIVLNHFYVTDFWDKDIRGQYTKEAFIDALLKSATPSPIVVGETPSVRLFDKERIKPYLLKASKSCDIFDRKQFFIAFHYAYAWAYDHDTTKKTLLVYHLHALRKEVLPALLQDFPQAKFIGMKREPIVASASLMKAHLQDKNYFALITGGYYLATYRYILRGFTYCVKTFDLDLLEVALEDLHGDPNTILYGISVFLKLDWLPCLLQPTVFGVAFWGDMHNRPCKGFNANLLKTTQSADFYDPHDTKVLKHLIGIRHTAYRHYTSQGVEPLMALPTKLERLALEQVHQDLDQCTQVAQIMQDRQILMHQALHKEDL